jgi:hypothetical protein
MRQATRQSRGRSTTTPASSVCALQVIAAARPRSGARAVKAHGKKVYAVLPVHGAQLAAVVDSFIRPTRNWSDDGYG